MRDHPTILVVDDNLAALALPGEIFYDRVAFLEDHGDLGFQFVFCSARDQTTGIYTWKTVSDFLSNLHNEPDVILLDMRFGDQSYLGLDILSRLSRTRPQSPVVMMTSAPKVELWEKCAALGAVDYIVKPIKPEMLKITVDRYSGRNLQFWLIGQGESFLASVDQAARASAGGMSSVLLMGASGTGKELFARFVHRHGPHCRGPFIAVHIPSISPNLLEAELFGYSKGAFTGAAKEERGRLLSANGGILFLDEIGDLSPTAQAALLRVLETREVTRLGDGKTSELKLQVVSATNANLAQKVKDNSFRLDLYNRLATTVIRLPRLNERIDDVQLITQHYLKRASIERSLDADLAPLPEDALTRLRSRPWPGNLRELWNYVQRVLDASKRASPTAAHFLSELATSQELTEEAQTNEEFATSDSAQLLRLLPVAALRNASSILDRLLIEELSIVWSALQATKDPVSGLNNRAKAVSLLKGHKCSTNECDRWLKKILSKMSPGLREQVIQRYPELHA